MDHLWPQLEAAMIEPVRETAISEVSGPQILQVRQSSRILRKSAQKPKTSVNRLSKIAGKLFVIPLLGSWWIYHQDKYVPPCRELNASGARGLIFQPLLMSTFIRTVAIILHAAAPSALDLTDMTKEYWDFLLSVRTLSNDPSVMESILFGILIILEITDPRRAAENFPKHVVGTQTWVASNVCIHYVADLDVFEGLAEGKAKSLAAGILLKLNEVVTKYERLLLGDIISFGSISSAPMGLRFK